MNKTSFPTPASVSHLEADVNYTIFHLQDGRRMVSSFTLKRFEEQPNFAGFLRVSKSHLLNPNYILDIKKLDRKMLIVLQNGNEVVVARRKVGLMKKRFEIASRNGPLE